MPFLFLVLADLCPEGFISGYLGNCYHFSRSVVTIDVAKTVCPSIHYSARLVAVETDAEWDFLRRQYQLLWERERKVQNEPSKLYISIHSLTTNLLPPYSVLVLLYIE